MPLGKIQMNLEIQGIYCFPEEWKVTDDANPTYFHYQLKFGGFHFQEAKIYPR